MRVGVRVAVGFASVLALGALVGGIGFKGLNDFAARVDDTQQMKELTDGISAAALLAARYRDTKDAAAATAVLGELDRADAALKAMESSSDEDFAEVRQAIQAYRDGVTRYVKIDKDNGSRLAQGLALTKDMARRADDIISLTNMQYAVQAAALAESGSAQQLQSEINEAFGVFSRAFLESRIAETRYEGSDQEQLRETFAAAAKTMVEKAAEMTAKAEGTGLAEPAGRLGALVDNYVAGFDELRKAHKGEGNFVTAMVAMRDIIKSLSTAFVDFEAAQVKTLAEAAAAAEKSRATVDSVLAAQRESMRLIVNVREVQLLERDVVASYGAADVADAATSASVRIVLAAGKLQATAPINEARAAAAEIVTNGKSYSDLLSGLAGALREQQKALAEMEAARAKVTELVTVAMRRQIEAMAAGHDLSNLIIALGTGGALVIGFVLAYAIGRGVSRPVSRLTAVMRRLADNDRGVEVPERNRKDEFGAMAAAVQVFKENAEMMGRMEEQQAAERRQAEEEKRKALHELADDFERGVRGIVDAVSSAAKNMHLSAESLNEVAGRVAEQSTSVSAATSQSSANVSTAASATEELASSIAEIGRQIDETSRVTADAVERAAATGTAIRGLASDAQKIGEVVGIITEIAEQTNLLALNATIEAARAGDAGKGFAVVASEVKNLANQTAKATGDIETRVTAIQTATADVVKGIETIGAVIGKISEIATSVASAVEEQGAATQEISRNVLEASKGAQTVAESVAGMNGDATQAGEAAQGVLDASTDLARQADALRTDVDQFVASVRSG